MLLATAATASAAAADTAAILLLLLPPLRSLVLLLLLLWFLQLPLMFLLTCGASFAHGHNPQQAPHEFAAQAYGTQTFCQAASDGDASFLRPAFFVGRDLLVWRSHALCCMRATGESTGIPEEASADSRIPAADTAVTEKDRPPSEAHRRCCLRRWCRRCEPQHR